MSEKSPSILQRLYSSDSEVRIAAIKDITGLESSAMELFGLALGDDDWRVRKAAVATFSKLDQPGRFINEVIAFLHHSENAGLRNAAIEILIALGPLVVVDLLHEISCSDVEVRKFVIDILGEIGDPRCAERLIASLDDADINVRYAAAETLGKLRSSAAVEPLLNLMSDPDPGLKFIILQSLSQIGEEVPTQQLFAYLDDRLLRKALFDCFAKIGGCEVIPSLVAGLNDPLRQVREAALGALFERHVPGQYHINGTFSEADADQIAEDLERILAGEKPGLKEAALSLYAAVGSTRDLRILLGCIADERLCQPTLQTFAALGEKPYGRLVSSFDSPDLFEMISLVFVGGELGFTHGLSLALDGARSGDPNLRHTSARALGRLGRETELTLLLRLLDDENSEIQDATAEAIAAIGQRCQRVVFSRIIPLLADHDPKKRMRVVRILSLLDGDEVEGQLLKAFKDSSSRVRCEAIRALQGRGDAVIPGVTLALTDESAEVRRLAVAAFGRYSQQKALPALKLAAGDNDIWVRAAVMRVLEAFTGTEVEQLIRQGTADPIGVVVIAALESSVKVCPDESRTLLEQALDHADEEVVKSAINQLNRLYNSHWLGAFASKLLNHAHWDVRIHAARTLGKSDLFCATEMLEGRLAQEDEALVRQAVESALSCRMRQKCQDR